MNGDALGMRTTGSWPLAWLGGTLIALAVTLAGVLLWMLSLSGTAKAVPSDPIQITLNTAPYLAATMGVSFFFLICLAMLAERRVPKSLSRWLLLAFFIFTPFALVVWAVQHLGDCFDACQQFSELNTLPPVLAVYGAGLLGALIAFRIRHRSWR